MNIGYASELFGNYRLQSRTVILPFSFYNSSEMKKIRKLDSLIQGIGAILSKDRCSLTTGEINILKDCISHLRECKNSPSKKQVCMEKLSKAIDIVLKFFLVGEKIHDDMKNLF